MLGSFNLFKILNSVGNSVQLYTEKLKTKNLPVNTIEANTIVVDAGLSIIGKTKKGRHTGSGITLKNNEVKYIIKLIRSLESRCILLKGITTKNNN